MSIAVKTNDPNTTGVNSTSSKSSLTGSNAADLQSSFLTLLVAQLKTKIRPIPCKITSSPPSWRKSAPSAELRS